MIAELARGNILTGFPWNQPGYAWVDTPLIQNAAHMGIDGVTFFTFLSAALVGAGFLAHGLLGRILLPCLGVALLAGGWVAGAERLANAQTKSEEQQQLVGIIQPAVPQTEKWKPELRDAQLRHLLEQTQALSAQGASLIVWPEAATPFAIAEMADLRETIGAMLQPGGALLTGAIRIEGRGSERATVYNSMLAISSDGQLIDFYDKQHLVPFGEYLPFDKTLSRIGIKALINMPGGFTPGDAERRSLSLPGLPPIIPMICYEAIFPDEIMERGAERGAIIHVTNDAWFGSSAGPYQHLAQAQVRAIERGVPVLRSANTGVSAVIDPYGRIVNSLPLDRPGTLLESVPKMVRTTLYHAWETYTITGILLILTVASLILRMIEPIGVASLLKKSAVQEHSGCL